MGGHYFPFAGEGCGSQKNRIACGGRSREANAICRVLRSNPEAINRSGNQQRDADPRIGLKERLIDSRKVPWGNQ